MKTRGFIAAVIAALVLAGIAVGVAAQPARGGRPHIGPMGGPGGFAMLPGLRELDLSDAQKEQIKTIAQSHRDEMRQAMERTREAQRALDVAAESGNANEADIRSKSTALAAAFADGAILRSKVNAEILAVLTPEQQQKLNEFRAQMQERLKQRSGRQRRF